MENRILIALGAATAMAFGTAAANPQEQDVPSFEELDADGNGYVSEQEVSSVACLRDNFRTLNPQSEEGLNRSEYQRAVSQFCRSERPAAE